jgi:hypothetical protein
MRSGGHIHVMSHCFERISPSHGFKGPLARGARAILIALFLTFAPQLCLAAVSNIPRPDLLVRPSQTDSGIRTFDFPHGIYLPAADSHRRGLLLFIPGTDTDTTGKAQSPGAPWFCHWAALLGYHVIYLMYPNTVAAAEACRDSPDSNAFAEFRWALIEGGDTPFIKVPREESIENRTIKLLAYLQRRYPEQGWGAFLRNGDIAWERVAVSGQSQGGGHAAIIATRYMVARVLCFGAPKDYSRRLNAPATWYDKSVTPPGRYFAFNHKQDKQGCGYKEQLENLDRLGVIAVAGTADIDQETRPFHHSHALFTNYPGTPIDSLTAHTSVIRGDLTMPTSRPHFAPVWGYMLTEPVP